jgi:hypothetical protein
MHLLNDAFVRMRSTSLGAEAGGPPWGWDCGK